MSDDEIFNQMWRLKIKQIVIFNLRYYNDMSYAEISKLMPDYGYKKGNSINRLSQLYYKSVAQIHLGRARQLWSMQHANNNHTR